MISIRCMQLSMILVLIGATATCDALQLCPLCGPRARAARRAPCRRRSLQLVMRSQNGVEEERQAGRLGKKDGVVGAEGGLREGGWRGAEQGGAGVAARTWVKKRLLTGACILATSLSSPQPVHCRGAPEALRTTGTSTTLFSTEPGVRWRRPDSKRLERVFCDIIVRVTLNLS